MTSSSTDTPFDSELLAKRFAQMRMTLCPGAVKARVPLALRHWRSSLPSTNQKGRRIGSCRVDGAGWAVLTWLDRWLAGFQRPPAGRKHPTKDGASGDGGFDPSTSSSDESSATGSPGSEAPSFDGFGGGESGGAGASGDFGGDSGGGDGGGGDGGGGGD